MPLAGGRPYRVCTRGPEARVAAWDRDGTPPGCRALSSLSGLAHHPGKQHSIPDASLPACWLWSREGACTKVLTCGDTGGVCRCVGR